MKGGIRVGLFPPRKQKAKLDPSVVMGAVRGTAKDGWIHTVPLTVVLCIIYMNSAKMVFKNANLIKLFLS